MRETFFSRELFHVPVRRVTNEVDDPNDAGQRDMTLCVCMYNMSLHTPLYISYPLPPRPHTVSLNKQIGILLKRAV